MSNTPIFNTLIVEDNAAFRQSLSQLLRSNFPGMVVASASTGSEAWKRIGEIWPGLIFVDIKLQDENGLDLARQFRHSHADPRVAVITGFNILEFRQAAYQNGADYFIPKDLATSADILDLVSSISSGQPLQWGLGSEYINPTPHIDFSKT